MNLVLPDYLISSHLYYNYIDTTFSVEHEAFGVIRVHELKPGGKLVPVRFYEIIDQTDF